jgi:apolipoprotein D and lipocalin family protein
MNKIIITIIMLLMLAACSNKNMVKLENHSLEEFSIEKYLGEWEEVARTDNKFERGLTKVTATYLREGSKIIAINKGWNEEKQSWSVSKGYVKETPRLGKLKVSFFRPFYGSYNVLYTDKSYKYALVGGSTSKYLWVLKRKGVEMPKELLEEYLNIAKKLGYNTEGMIFMDTIWH